MYNDNLSNIDTLDPASADKEVLRASTIGLNELSSFIKKEYFSTFIKDGGSKVKLISGKKGAGKSHLLSLLSYDAADEGFLTISLDANEILLSDMTNLYVAIFSHLDLNLLIQRISSTILKNLGYEFNKLNENKNIYDWLVDNGHNVAIARQEIRNEIKNTIIDNPLLDFNLAQIFSLFILDYLGLTPLGESQKQIFLTWLSADSKQKLSIIRSQALAGYKIKKTNARGLLKSLSELVHLAGYSGLFVSLDNVDSISQTSSLQQVKYTKMRRDDAYEVIRQIIDDVDYFSNFFLSIAFDRILLDHEKNGLKSYQALWLRVQNELVSAQINYFTDMLDLDKINAQLFTADQVIKMSERLSELYNSKNYFTHVVTREEADRIIKESKYGSMSIPLLTNMRTLRIKEDIDD